MGGPWEVCWKRDANIILAIYHVIVMKEQLLKSSLIRFGIQINMQTLSCSLSDIH